MNLPDFMAYKDKFTQSAFVEKISHVAKRAGAKMVYAALILYYTLESDKVALKDKAMIIGALGYLISPLDVIPDAIPIATTWQCSSLCSIRYGEMFLRMRSRRLTTSSHSGLMKMSFLRQKISSRRIRKILRSDSFRTHSFFCTRF